MRKMDKMEHLHKLSQTWQWTSGAKHLIQAIINIKTVGFLQRRKHGAQSETYSIFGVLEKRRKKNVFVYYHY